jgi:hypothetical protein
VFSRYIRLYNTVKFLKPKQIYYRLYYFGRIKIKKITGSVVIFSKESKSFSLKLEKSIHISDSYIGNGEFRFLNLSTKFKDIDWNYAKHGKLWTYNLTYFDFLSKESDVDKRELIESFINNIKNIKDGMEPFPISLRGINWIKYLSYGGIKNQKIDDSLYAQYYILLDNLEYHLLGNHLLENGFSLLFGAYYFRDETLYKKAKEILLEQLDEQILDDGGHFELTPMYHQIMLFRLLDCINLVQNNSWKGRELLEFFRAKSELMLGWLQNISYKNGEIPLLNDSANSIAPKTVQLIDYSKRLNLEIPLLKLSDSGYRKISNENYECIVDIGHIGAEYIPGHAHADTFNFELRIKGRPFIVDTGLSTYETCKRRTVERSTLSHNSVEVNGQNQSEVWGGFRVANRAKIVNLKESNGYIEATHDGYKPIFHTRKWTFEESRVIIEDSLNRDSIGVARLHFHPDVTKEEILAHLSIDSNEFEFGEYFYSPEFNTKITAIVISINFINFLKLDIEL